MYSRMQHAQLRRQPQAEPLGGTVDMMSLFTTRFLVHALATTHAPVSELHCVQASLLADRPQSFMLYTIAAIV